MEAAGIEPASENVP